MASGHSSSARQWTAYRSCSPYDWPNDTGYPEHLEATARVEREDSTTNNKRIGPPDRMRTTSWSEVENKIWSGQHNDLGEYRKHCEKSGDGRPVLGIGLSPQRVTNHRLRDHRFVSITYGDLVKQVRRRMGNHIGPHSTQYQYLLFDFLVQASRCRKDHDHERRSTGLPGCLAEKLREDRKHPVDVQQDAERTESRRQRPKPIESNP